MINVELDQRIKTIIKSLKRLGFREVKQLKYVYINETTYFISRGILNGGTAIIFNFGRVIFKFRTATNKFMYTKEEYKAWHTIKDYIDPSDIAAMLVLYK